MRDQFGIKPKVNTYSYRTPYPPAYDLIPLPNRYKVQDFTKFSRQDDTSTIEHVNRFIIQCGEAANRDELRVRLFSSSLLGSAFTWLYFVASKLSYYLGRSGKTVPQILLFWSP